MAASGNGAPIFAGRVYRCPVCPAIWPSCHDLRNHLYTIHPNEAAELVIPFMQYVENSRWNGRVALRQAPTPPVPAVTVRGSFVPLPPNPAFWEGFHRGGSPPVEIDFFAPLVAVAAPTLEPVAPAVMCISHLSDSESSELDILV